MRSILVEDRFNEYIAHGHLWAGWLGSQWAITDTILAQLRPYKGLVVLCGGPGDLAFNAYFHGKAKFAINVDSSYDAIAYGLWLNGSYTAPVRNYPEEVEAINKRYKEIAELIPQILVKPRLAAVDLFSITNRRRDNVYHIWDDAFAFVKSTLATLPPVDIYIASPTILDYYGAGISFYSMYDLAFSTRRIGFSEWVTNECSYLVALVRAIKEAQPAARIIFGVGEGKTSISEYTDIVQGEVIHEERFITETGYHFDDWIILFDPNLHGSFRG